MNTNNRNVRLQQPVVLLTVMERAEDLIKNKYSAGKLAGSVCWHHFQLRSKVLKQTPETSWLDNNQQNECNMLQMSENALTLRWITFTNCKTNQIFCR